MSKYIKWLGAGLGFTLGGPIGAVLGYALGSIVEESSLVEFNVDREKFERKRKEHVVESTAGDFEISLLVLSSIVIKADNKIDTKELDYVRAHFVKIYGKAKANDAFKLFNGIIKEKVSTKKICDQIKMHVSHASRLQLIHFLFGIAKSDGNVSADEEAVIKTIAGYFYINNNDYESIKAMFYNEVNAAYIILEITKNASESEIKTAYRKMAKKYHPDRVQNVSDEQMIAVKEKFQRIQDAYEKIKAERGF